MSEQVVTGPVGVPPIITAKMNKVFPKPEGSCLWFLKCPNKATQERQHATLGPVPLCDDCAAFVDGGGQR